MKLHSKQYQAGLNLSKRLAALQSYVTPAKLAQARADWESYERDFHIAYKQAELEGEESEFMAGFTA